MTSNPHVQLFSTKYNKTRKKTKNRYETWSVKRKEFYFLWSSVGKHTQTLQHLRGSLELYYDSQNWKDFHKLASENWLFFELFSFSLEDYSRKRKIRETQTTAIFLRIFNLIQLKKILFLASILFLIYAVLRNLRGINEKGKT